MAGLRVSGWPLAWSRESRLIRVTGTASMVFHRGRCFSVTLGQVRPWRREIDARSSVRPYVTDLWPTPYNNRRSVR
jgi:hypothetical protein